MNETDTSALRDALIREGVALAVMAFVLWYFGPGKILLAGLRHRAAVMWRAPADRIESELARFRAEVSRWEHEQTAQPDSGAGGEQPCGC